MLLVLLVLLLRMLRMLLLLLLLLLLLVLLAQLLGGHRRLAERLRVHLLLHVRQRGVSLLWHLA